MDDELQQPEPKISFVVGIVGTIFAALLDLLSLIPFVGDIEEIPAGVILVLNVIFGMGSTVIITQGIAMVLKAIPVVQELPLWTPAWLITWYVENHPSKVTDLVEQGVEIAGMVDNVGFNAERVVPSVERPASALNNGAEATVGRTSASPNYPVWRGDPESYQVEDSFTLPRDVRPSERSREYDADGDWRHGGRRSVSEAPVKNQGDISDSAEQPQRQAREEEYESMMASEAEVPPMDVLEEVLFSVPTPSQVRIPDSEPTIQDKETDAQRRLRERFEARAKNKNGLPS